MPKRFLLLRQNARGRGDLMRHQRIWHGGEGTYYLQMICGIYAVLGIFLIAAARNPAENRSLISFTIWSSVVHAAIMAARPSTPMILARSSAPWT